MSNTSNNHTGGRPVRLAAIAVALASIANAALAWEPPAPVLKKSALGKPWIEVVKDPQGAEARVRSVVEIAAPPQVVFALLIDCAATRRLMPSNRGCKVISREADGSSDVREHILKFPLEPEMRTVFRTDLVRDQRLTVNRIEGDIELLIGEWRLTPLNGGKSTRLVHEMRITTGCGVPALIRSYLRREQAQALANLKAASEAKGQRDG